jgi:hypothetical protein
MCTSPECGAAPYPLDSTQMREYLRGYALVTALASCSALFAAVVLLM